LGIQSSTVADGSTAQDGNLRLANDKEDIDPNTCCMYLVTYKENVLAGDGVAWIPCPCGRYCMKIVQRDVWWTKTTWSVIVQFVLTFYLCMHNGICKYVANSCVHISIIMIFEPHYHDTSVITWL